MTMPVRVGAPDGPSRGAARGDSWRRTGSGFYVPASVSATPEQRIVEAALPLPRGGRLTGWASLRLQRGAFFDGRGSQVPIVVDDQVHPRPRPGVRWIRRPQDGSLTHLHGLPLVPAAEALIDHVLQLLAAGHPRPAVVAVDMAVAARLCTLDSVTAAVHARPRIRGRSRVLEVLARAREGSASPPESRLRLLWTLDTVIPEPILNPWVLDESGRRIGAPDLLEPCSGLAVEYDGSPHAGARRRARDADKDGLYRECGIECVRVTGPDMQTPLRVIDRLERAYARALTAARPQRWKLGGRFTGACRT